MSATATATEGNKMKISPETQTILKNFATIHKSILITPGNVLRTRTASVFAEARVVEEFPLEKGIFELSNLLSALGLFTDPELEFTDNFLSISDSDGSSEAEYAYAGNGMVTLPHPKKMKALPENVIEFTLTEDQWTRLQKATAVFQKPEIKIVSNGKTVKIGTANHKHEMGNSFSMVLDSNPNGLKCNMVFKREDLNLLKGSYTGVVTPTYTMFKNTSGFDLTYYIGVEPTTSTFGE